MINFEELGKPGPNTPMPPQAYDILDGRHAYRSHQLVRGLLERLEKTAWYQYRTLQQVYLDADANPQRLDRWRTQSVGTQLQAQVVDRAIDWMLDEIGDHRLVVPLDPIESRGDKDQQRKVLMQLGLTRAFEKMDHGASYRRAAEETAEELRVSRATVYRWLKAIEPSS